MFGEAAYGFEIYHGPGYVRDFGTGALTVTDEVAFRRYLEQYRHATDAEDEGQGEVAQRTIPARDFLRASSGEAARTWERLNAASKVPPMDVDLDRLMSDLNTAIALLHPADGWDDMLAAASPDDHRDFVGYLQVRVADWGERLLEELDADAPGSPLSGSTQVREQRARTLQRRLADTPVLLREALSMVFFGSMVTLSVHHDSPGGRRMLDLCMKMKDNDRPALAAALDCHEGRRRDGSLPEALADTVISWRRINPGRMAPLTHEMYDALKLDGSAPARHAGTVGETGASRSPHAAQARPTSSGRPLQDSLFDVHFDIQVMVDDDTDEASDHGRQLPRVLRDGATSPTSAQLCAATREAIQLVDERSALPAVGVCGKALRDAFHLPAVVLDLRDPRISDVTPLSVQAAMDAVDGVVPTFLLVRSRATDWGLRLLRALNADDPGGDSSGATSPGAAAADALCAALCDRPLLSERAVPMLYLASMIDTEVDPLSAGGRRVLQLCHALPAENRAMLTSLFNSHDGLDDRGQPLHPALVPYVEQSWQDRASDQVPDLAREMFKVLGLRMLR